MNANTQMRFAGNLLLAMGLCVGLTAPAMAQSVRLLGDFRDWSSYATSDDAGQLCFATTKPSSVSPEPEDYSQAYLYVTHRPGQGVRAEFNLVAGYELQPDSGASVSVGSNTYPLFTQGDAAWLDDPSQSSDLAGNIRAGSSLTIETTTARGIKVTQTYSLSGATAAQRAIDGEC